MTGAAPLPPTLEQRRNALNELQWGGHVVLLIPIVVHPKATAYVDYTANSSNLLHAAPMLTAEHLRGVETRISKKLK